LATAFPDKDEISRTNRMLFSTADVRDSLDVGAIQYRRRSIPILLLDVSHIQRLFR
jgi:hypothetical protein